VGGILLLLILGYILLYLRGLLAAGRYRDGFVLTQCPVCQAGQLHLDERQERMLGIPVTRRTLRCDNCRSVLRQTGARRWRYAVDPVANPTLYARFNGRELTDDELLTLAAHPVPPPGEPPQFIDGESNRP